MKVQSGFMRLKLLAALGMFVALALTTAAHAVPAPQVLRSFGSQTFSGLCCFSFNETVSAKEPAKPVPAVVTWSSDTKIGGDFLVGLNVNGGPCTFFGAGSLLESGATVEEDSRTLQFIIAPEEGLTPGTNAFTLCGGATFSSSATLLMHFNVLEVRLSK